MMPTPLNPLRHAGRPTAALLGAIGPARQRSTFGLSE